MAGWASFLCEKIPGLSSQDPCKWQTCRSMQWTIDMIILCVFVCNIYFFIWVAQWCFQLSKVSHMNCSTVTLQLSMKMLPTVIGFQTNGTCMKSFKLTLWGIFKCMNKTGYCMPLRHREGRRVQLLHLQRSENTLKSSELSIQRPNKVVGKVF